MYGSLLQLYTLCIVIISRWEILHQSTQNGWILNARILTAKPTAVPHWLLSKNTGITASKSAHQRCSQTVWNPPEEILPTTKLWAPRISTQTVATAPVLGPGRHLLFACTPPLSSLLPLVRVENTKNISPKPLSSKFQEGRGFILFLFNSPCLEECQAQAKTLKRKNTAWMNKWMSLTKLVLFSTP